MTCEVVAKVMVGRKIFALSISVAKNMSSHFKVNLSLKCPSRSCPRSNVKSRLNSQGKIPCFKCDNNQTKQNHHQFTLKRNSRFSFELSSTFFFDFQNGLVREGNLLFPKPTRGKLRWQRWTRMLEMRKWNGPSLSRSRSQRLSQFLFIFIATFN